MIFIFLRNCAVVPIICAGLPPIIMPFSRQLFVTTLPAATIQLSAIVTPGSNIVPIPIKQFSPTSIGPTKSVPFSETLIMELSCVQNFTPVEIVVWFPTEIRYGSLEQIGEKALHPPQF